MHKLKLEQYTGLFLPEGFKKATEKDLVKEYKVAGKFGLCKIGKAKV